MLVEIYNATMAIVWLPVPQTEAVMAGNRFGVRGARCTVTRSCHANAIKLSSNLTNAPLRSPLTRSGRPPSLMMEHARDRFSHRTVWNRRWRSRLCRAGGRDQRSRRHLPLPDLRQMGGSLCGEDRSEDELSIDRIGRRHQADHRQDRRFRRLGYATEIRGS